MINAILISDSSVSHHFNLRNLLTRPLHSFIFFTLCFTTIRSPYLRHQWASYTNVITYRKILISLYLKNTDPKFVVIAAIKLELCDDDEFIVLACDGIWVLQLFGSYMRR